MRERLLKLWPYGLVALVAFGGGLFLGTRNAPSRIEEKTHTETTAKVERTEDVKAAEKIAEQTGKKVRTKRTSFRPDGSVSNVVERTSETVKDRHEDRQTDTAKVENSITLKVEDKHTIKDFGPRARVDLLAGAVLQNPITNGGSPFSAMIVGVGASGRMGNSPIWVGGQFQMAGDKANPFNLTRDLRLLVTVGWAF